MRHKRRQVHTTPTVLFVDTVAPEATSQDIPALPPTAVTAAEAESKAARTGGDGTAKTLQSKENPSLSATNYPILWWTPPLPPTSQEEEEKEAEASLPYTLDTCGLDYRCTFTADRSLLLTSNVILFRASQLEEHDLPPASERPSSQAWVLNTVLEDAEEIHRKEAIISVLDPTHIWSHSFQTADFIETVFQSRRPLSNSTQKQQQRQSFVDIVTMPPRVDLQEKNRLRRLGKENGGRASAVWITSTEGGGCVDAPSGRENYVRELVMVMDVDIYGPCMNNSVWLVHPGTQKPYTTQEIMAEYKFVFALERVNCQDYITNHLADALTVGAVPIVDGQPLDYSRFSPTENAFLQISEFLAPELLAQEVDRLDRNDTLYLERLIYRGRGVKEVDEMAEGEGAVVAALSPLFKQTFGGADSESAMSATSSASPSTRTWPPDRHGIYCGICQLAHSLAQDTYDWTAHSQQRDAITNRTLSLAATTPTCEPSPRYLPGLPIQMQAYDAYLQVQNEIAFDRQLEEMEDLLRQEQEVDNGSVLGPTMAHVVNVTVSFDDNTNTNTGFNVSDPSGGGGGGGGGGATNQSLLENNSNFISQPSIVVLHQDVSTSSSSLSKAQELSGLDPATTHHHILDDNTLTSSASADDGTTLPLSEVHYLLLLIMTMFVGVGALVLILSKSARHKLFWPWRHLFYKKLPRDDLNIDALTLERVMLQELGEDLLYD